MIRSCGVPTCSPCVVASRGEEGVDSLIARWPVDEPMFVLCSGGAVSPWNRWTILARPSVFARHREGRTEVIVAAGHKIADDGKVGFIEREIRRRVTHDPVGDLVSLFDMAEDGSGSLFSRSILVKTGPKGDGYWGGTGGEATGGAAGGLPFRGGWMGVISYDLGLRLEPTACFSHGGGDCFARVDDSSGSPLFELAWCDDFLVYDRLEDRWYEAGDPPVRAGVSGDGVDVCGEKNGEGYYLGDFIEEMGQRGTEAAVARAIEYIRAGDIFQANISKRFHAVFKGNRRALLSAARKHHPSWYGAYLELDEERTLLSLSPELFVSFDGVTREVITRPIKGTEGVEVDAGVLEASVKDQAELNMIVDLMRNDLGRVCEFGSVGVRGGRMIETHGTVHHGVATVGGLVRAGLGMGEIIKAIFPGGSITGAPKIRAMQIIDELEDFKRGQFFGAIGYAGRGGACFNLAIRTMLIEGERAMYVAGGGIVADSDPGREYEEMLVKVRGARALCS